MTKFKGFPAEATKFFRDIERNNDREWFKAHKQVYERACQAPMEDLLDDLGGGKLFRIYRDVRFSKDKSPYKTYMGATFDGGYISMTAESFSIATGAYMPDAAGLERYRKAVDTDSSGKPLEKIVSKLEAKGYEFGAHDSLKTVPKGYDKEHPRLALLKHKGLATWKGWPVGKWLQTREPLERIKGFLKDAKPLNEWLARHVGEITHPER
jgi:uncharacterized protein (TIGR02453 family)